MADILLSNSGRGKEIREYLEEALNLPKKLRWFDVRFAVDEPVTVRCEFMPAPAEEVEDDDPPAVPSHGSLDD